MFWGADSWICRSSNCMARACCDLGRPYRLGDVAKAKSMMKTLCRAKKVFESDKFVQNIEYGCEFQGLPVDGCCAPLDPITDDEKAEFRAAMEPILAW